MGLGRMGEFLSEELNFAGGTRVCEGEVEWAEQNKSDGSAIFIYEV